MIDKFDAFMFGFMSILIIMCFIYCGWFVYNNLDSRITELENRNFIDINFIKE